MVKREYDINELKNIIISVAFNRKLDETGTIELLASAQHPRMQLIGGHIQTIVHDTTAAVVRLKVWPTASYLTANVTASTTVGAAVDFNIISSIIIGELLPMNLEVVTAGGAGSAYQIHLMFRVTSDW